MAHIYNFEIPAQFVFRPFEAEWEIGSAEILGWEQPSRGLVLGSLPPRKNVLQVRIESGRLGMLGIGEVVDMDRASMPPGVLAAHENPGSAPDVSGRRFDVLVCRNPEFTRGFPSRLKPDNKQKDARAMLREFFSLGAEEWTRNVRRFLNRWGLWSHGYGYLASGMSGRSLPAFVLVFPDAIRAQRERLRDGILKRSSHQWLTANQPLSLSTMEDAPYFRVECHFCEDALKAVITIEHLEGRDWGFCKRPDCRKDFTRTTKQKRVYCSQYCAHLENVRKSRDSKTKRRGGEGHAKN